MPFLLAEILNFQGSTHRIGVGSFSYLVDGYADLLNKIIDIRHNKGAHSKTLAADSGISEKTLHRFEKGIAIPSISRFLNIIHALDCEMLIVEK